MIMKEAFEFLKNNYKTILVILLVIGIIVSIIISFIKSSKEEQVKKKSLFIEEGKQAKSLKTYAHFR